MQGEIFAAEGYAKSTGEVGVCIATSGPGATNLVTGLADALLDSVPLVAITGQVSPVASAAACALHVLSLSSAWPPLAREPPICLWAWQTRCWTLCPWSPSLAKTAYPTSHGCQLV